MSMCIRSAEASARDGVRMLTTITAINTTIMAIVAAMTGKRLAMTVSTPTIAIAIRDWAIGAA